MKEYLEIGKITSSKGLRGEVKVDLWCDSPEFFEEFDYFYLDKEKLKIDSCYSSKRSAVVKFKNINTKTDAEFLKGKILYINRKDAKLEKDVYFLQDVIGSKVLDTDTKREYGKVINIFKTGANDVYEIVSDQDKVYLLPAIKEVIIDIKISDKLVFIRPLGGIFDNED